MAVPSLFTCSLVPKEKHDSLLPREMLSYLGVCIVNCFTCRKCSAQLSLVFDVNEMMPSGVEQCCCLLSLSVCAGLRKSAESLSERDFLTNVNRGLLVLERASPCL